MQVRKRQIIRRRSNLQLASCNLHLATLTMPNAIAPPRTRLQDLEDIGAAPSGAGDNDKAYVWNNSTGKFDLVDHLTQTEGDARYLRLSGSTTAVAINTSTALTGFLGAGQVQIDKTSNGTVVLHRESADAGGPTLEFLKRRSGWGVVSNADRIGTIQFGAADSVDACSAASIFGEVDGTPGSNDMPGRLVFSTTGDGAPVVTEAMRIDSSQTLIMASGKRIATDEIRANGASGLKLHNSSSVGLFVDTGGNVGIGTITPTLGLLQITGNLGGGGTAGLYFDPIASGAGTQYGIRILGNGAGATDFMGLGIHGGTLTNWKSSIWIGNEASRPGINCGYANTVLAPTWGAIFAGPCGIGDSSPDGMLDIEQISTTAAIPVIELNQADLSEEFINFISTVGAGNPLDTAAVGTYYGKFRVQVQGVGYKYVPMYNT